MFTAPARWRTAPHRVHRDRRPSPVCRNRRRVWCCREGSETTSVGEPEAPRDQRSAGTPNGYVPHPGDNAASAPRRDSRTPLRRDASAILQRVIGTLSWVDPADDCRDGGTDVRTPPAAAPPADNAPTRSGGRMTTISPPSTRPTLPWDTTGGAVGLSLLERQLSFERRKHKLLRQAYRECGRITSIFAKTFYLGTLFLPEHKRNAVWAVYVWCRRTDDLVDGPRVRQRDALLRYALTDWEHRLRMTWHGHPRDALDLALYDTVSRFPQLRMEPFCDMIQGMLMDVNRARYHNFDELYLYCYRVAGTVGLMTLPIMGVAPERCAHLAEAAEPALALGIALQLTNILRDVGEDAIRGRIYLPLDEMEHFGYSPDELMRGVVNENYRRLLRFQIARVRGYYRTAEHGIAKLHSDARLPIRASLDMYRQILDSIEDNDYDNFHRRAYVSRVRKTLTLPVSWLRVQQAEGTALGGLWGRFDRAFMRRDRTGEEEQ